MQALILLLLLMGISVDSAPSSVVPIASRDDDDRPKTPSADDISSTNVTAYVSYDYDPPDLPAIADDDPSEFYHGHTVEVWLGNVKSNVGNLIGSDLYDQIWKGIDKICPAQASLCPVYEWVKYIIWVPYMNDKGFIGNPGPFKLYVRAFYWGSEQIRRLLIGSVAGAVEAMSKNDDNCFSGPAGSKKGPSMKICNVGDRVKVNTLNGHIHVEFKSPTKYGHFYCAKIKDAVGRKQDELADEMVSVFGGPFSKTVDCLSDAPTKREVGN